MLTVHLRELEQEGILTRTVFAEVPPRVEYALSPHGATLNGVMRALGEWGASHAKRKNLRLGNDAASRDLRDEDAFIDAA